MKKALFLLAICMLLLLSGTANAQSSVKKVTNTQSNARTVSSPSIIGTWSADVKSFAETEGLIAKNATFLLTFNTNKSLSMTIDILYEVKEDDMTIELGFKDSANGVYTKNGNDLSFNINKQTANANIYKFNINLTPEMEASMKEMGMTKAQLTKTFKDSMIFDEFIDELKDVFDMFSGATTIQSLTAKQLVLMDGDGTKFTFIRK